MTREIIAARGSDNPIKTVRPEALKRFDAVMESYRDKVRQYDDTMEGMLLAFVTAMQDVRDLRAVMFVQHQRFSKWRRRVRYLRYRKLHPLKKYLT